MKFIYFFLILTLMSKTCSTASEFFKVVSDKEKTAKIERKRRQASVIETNFEEDDYSLRVYKARIFHIKENQLSIMTEFRVNERRMYSECELISLPIQFVVEVQLPNGTMSLYSVFGFLNLKSSGANSDEIAKKEVIHSFE